MHKVQTTLLQAESSSVYLIVCQIRFGIESAVSTFHAGTSGWTKCVLNLIDMKLFDSPLNLLLKIHVSDNLIWETMILNSIIGVVAHFSNVYCFVRAVQMNLRRM